MSDYHSNTGRGVFKRGVQNQKVLFPKNQNMKLLNFENWVIGGPEVFKNQDFKS